jgi:RHS repeat-associated protein
MQNSSSFFQGQARFSNGFFGIYHSPFGVELKGRNLKKSSAKNYRYGFTGIEKDNEIKGAGSSYSFNARMYDCRIGRWLSLDPMADGMPSEGGYNYCHNNGINFTDPDGESPISMFLKAAAKQGIKVAAKEFIEHSVKTRLKNYATKSFAKQFIKDADKILEVMDQDWWEYIVEFIPVAGDAYGGYTLGKKTLQLWQQLKKIEKQVQKYTDRYEKAVKGTSTNLIAAMKKAGIAIKEGYQAHHIIPKAAMEKSSAIMDAIGGGFDLHGAFNGIGMKAVKDGGSHGNHPQHTNQIVDFMENWAKEAKLDGTYSPLASKNKLTELVKHITPQLNKIKDSSSKVNEIRF